MSARISVFSGFEKEQVRSGDLGRFARACDCPLALSSPGTFTTTPGYLSAHPVELFVHFSVPRNPASLNFILVADIVSLSFKY